MLVAKKQEINAELERREKARREAVQQPHGSGDEGGRGKSAGAHTITEADIEEEQEKIASYEAAFKEIKEATGVADVNEVIQKFITQEETHKNLQAMTRESQAKIDALVQQKSEVTERVQRLKYSLSADEAQAGATTHDDRKYERQRLKYERLTKVLVAVKAGIQHLSERLEGVKLDEPPLVLSDDNMVDVLKQCEQRLRIVLEAIRQEEDALVRDMGESALQKSAGLPLEPPVLNNYRVKEADGGEENVPSEEEFEEDLEEEVVDREALKKQSGTILDKATKKTKKRRGKKTA